MYFRVMKILLAILLLSPSVIAKEVNVVMTVNSETGKQMGYADYSITKAKLVAISICDDDLDWRALERKYKGIDNALHSEEVMSSKCEIFQVNDEVLIEDIDAYVEYVQEQQKLREEQERLRQEELILRALVDRCTNFGWKTEDNIASCVKQEAYRDLKTQEQEYRVKLLEQQLINANANSPKERPLFLDILDFYIQESERKENAQLRRDIKMLQSETRSLRNRQNTEAALQLLYRGN